MYNIYSFRYFLIIQPTVAFASKCIKSILNFSSFLASYKLNDMTTFWGVFSLITT